MKHRLIQAQIEYRAAEAGATHLRGTEVMSLQRLTDGNLIYRCTSENYDKQLLRDCFLRLDAEYRPTESYLSQAIAGRYSGSAWYRFGEREVSCRGWNHVTGDVDVTQGTDGPALGFCAHPISSDALLMVGFDHANRERRQVPPRMFMSSTDMVGAEGPTLVPISIAIEYLGRESCATPLGAMEADHYSLPLGNSGELAEHIWCMAGTPIFLRAEVRGVAYPTVFELTTLRIEA